MGYAKIPTRSSADTNSSADINQLMDNIEMLAGNRSSMSGIAEYSADITYGAGDAVWIDGDQYISLVAANLNNHPITSPNHWEIASDFKEICKQYHNARPIMAGLNDVDNYRDAAYQQQYFLGYYSKGGKNFEAYKVHLDGTQITTDATLEAIFDVGGSNEYFALDTLAPESLGIRTLPDVKGRVLRSVDAALGDTEDVGVAQEDAFQGHRFGTDSAHTLKLELLDLNGGAIDSIRLIHGTDLTIQTDGTNGTPRTASETRMKNYTVGVAYIIVLLEV